MPAQIDIDRERIAEFCRRNGIRKLSLFGSVLTDRFGPDSDVDVLVEFEPNADVTLFDMGGMWNELHEMFGRDVSLCTPQSISRHLQDDVLATAEVQYAA